MSLLFEYDFLGFVDSSYPCPPALITLSDAAFPSPNSNHIFWLKQDQLLLNAIVGSVSTTLVQFISTATTSHIAWTTFEKKYAYPSRGRIMTHRQNLASPQQGNQTIIEYIMAKILLILSKVIELLPSICKISNTILTLLPL